MGLGLHRVLALLASRPSNKAGANVGASKHARSGDDDVQITRGPPMLWERLTFVNGWDL